MHDRFAADQTRERAAGSRPPRLPQTLDELGRKPAMRNRVEVLAVIGQQAAKGRLAQKHRLFEDRVEHRGEVAGRGVDNLADLGGGGLAGQRRVALGAALRELAPEIGDGPRGIRDVVPDVVQDVVPCHRTGSRPLPVEPIIL